MAAMAYDQTYSPNTDQETCNRSTSSPPMPAQTTSSTLATLASTMIVRLIASPKRPSSTWPNTHRCSQMPSSALSLQPLRNRLSRSASHESTCHSQNCPSSSTRPTP
ncbi:ser/Thr protein phosphatase family protein [Alternaria alternata]|nr:ser/Thr protein phosphatase family protein [Alternaria alternata]